MKAQKRIDIGTIADWHRRNSGLAQALSRNSKAAEHKQIAFRRFMRMVNQLT